MFILIPGEPIEKPNIRSPKWKAWRRWADRLPMAVVAQGWHWREFTAQAEAPELLWVAAYFGLPPSWPRERKLSAVGAIHRQKPDGNHVWNATADALFKRDELVADQRCLKLWDDGLGPRVEIWMGERYDQPEWPLPSTSVDRERVLRLLSRP